jgi:hypothetical protein
MVSFTYNGTGGLGAFQMEKTYRLFDQPGETPPIWAVENTDLSLFDISPIWGLVDDEYLNFTGVQVLKSDHLYLPASKALMNPVPTFDTLASAVIPGLTLQSLYGSSSSLQTTGQRLTNLDYTGTQNTAILNKWAELGTAPESIANMLNLIYVDQMTQIAVGSKSLLNVTVAKTPGLWEAQILADRIKYDLRYAIPVSHRKNINH